MNIDFTYKNPMTYDKFNLVPRLMLIVSHVTIGLTHPYSNKKTEHESISILFFSLEWTYHLIYVSKSSSLVEKFRILWTDFFAMMDRVLKIYEFTSLGTIRSGFCPLINT